MARRCTAGRTWPTVPLMSMTRSLVPGKYSFARDSWIRAELCVWNSARGRRHSAFCWCLHHAPVSHGCSDT